MNFPTLNQQNLILNYCICIRLGFARRANDICREQSVNLELVVLQVQYRRY